MTEPNSRSRTSEDATQPVEVQHYGPAQPREPMHRSNWDEAPSWSNRRPSVQSVEVRRGLGAVPVIAMALVAGILSGALSAVAVTNVLDDGSAAAGGPSATSSPQSQPVSDVRIDESSAVIEAVDRVGPAVVTITTSGGGILGSATGTGSGVIYDPDGWILTNRHVVEDADSLQVTLDDGQVFEDAEVYGIDTMTDLAIVKIDGEDLPAAPIGSSDNLKPGQLAIAIGNPLGQYENTVTTGIVSGLGRQIFASDAVQASDPDRLRNLIQTDAAINPGNSGGPLVNSAGQIIGINTAVSTTAQGIGFAIPINVARPIMDQALAGEPLARPYIGVWYTPVNPAIADSEDLPVDYGAYIATASGEDPIIAGSPAEAAGLQAGDVIVAVDGEQLSVEADLSMTLLPYSPGDTITLRVLRDNSVREIDLTLEVQPES
jgi:S1-C subfamily serine protease